MSVKRLEMLEVEVARLSSYQDRCNIRGEFASDAESKPWLWETPAKSFQKNFNLNPILHHALFGSTQATGHLLKYSRYCPTVLDLVYLIVLRS